jgi:hypothetical protein
MNPTVSSLLTRMKFLRADTENYKLPEGKKKGAESLKTIQA